MKLNHLNLPVQNVAAATAFFERHFGFKCKEVKGGNMIAILNGSDGFVLVLMSAAMSKGSGFAYPETFHIGFMLDSNEEVSTTWQRLKDDGIEPGRAPGKIRDTFGFYFLFDCIMIEVGHYI